MLRNVVHQSLLLLWDALCMKDADVWIERVPAWSTRMFPKKRGGYYSSDVVAVEEDAQNGKGGSHRVTVAVCALEEMLTPRLERTVSGMTDFSLAMKVVAEEGAAAAAVAAVFDVVAALVPAE